MLINIYNRAQVPGGGYIIDHMDTSRLIEGRTVLASDFNACSPVWDLWISGRQYAETVERLIKRHRLIINNNDYQPTRYGKNYRSVIDLTLSTRGLGELVTWEIDELLATTSDYEVIVFEWMLLNEVILERKIGVVRN